MRRTQSSLNTRRRIWFRFTESGKIPSLRRAKKTTLADRKRSAACASSWAKATPSSSLRADDPPGRAPGRLRQQFPASAPEARQKLAHSARSGSVIYKSPQAPWARHMSRIEEAQCEIRSEICLRLGAAPTALPKFFFELTSEESPPFAANAKDGHPARKWLGARTGIACCALLPLKKITIAGCSSISNFHLRPFLLSGEIFPFCAKEANQGGRQQ